MPFGQLQLPFGMPMGTPMGMQVVGPRRHADRFTLGVAAALEKILQTIPATKRPIPDPKALQS